MKLYGIAYIVVSGDTIMNGKTRIYLKPDQAKGQLTRLNNMFYNGKKHLEELLAKIGHDHTYYQRHLDRYNNNYKDKEPNYKILVANLDWKLWSD